MKAVMYHYVRKSSEKLKHFRYLSFENFCRQLDYFESEYGFVTKEDFAAMFKDNKVIHDSVILTFDDGFLDHYEFVLPELQKRNLWGIFYIPVGIYKENKVLDVHRIHYLVGANDSQNILQHLLQIINKEMLNDINVQDYKTLTYSTQNNDEATVLIKRILNYFISYEWREFIIDQLMKEFYDDPNLHQELYMNQNHLIEMKEAGMVIGSHSVDHLLMSKLSDQEQKSEICMSFDILENIVGKLFIKTFCYPYGGFYSFNEMTEKILDKEGCLFSFNVEERDITSEDINLRRQALPRFDCNAFPNGEASLG